MDSAFPKLCGVDSRFRGNDCGLERPCLANDTTTRAGVWNRSSVGYSPPLVHEFTDFAVVNFAHLGHLRFAQRGQIACADVVLDLRDTLGSGMAQVTASNIRIHRRAS